MCRIRKNIVQTLLIVLILCTCLNTSSASSSLEKGIVTFIFDDGHTSIYKNAYPIFKKMGYTASVAIYTKGWRDGYPGLMTKEQVLQMQKSGWEVMSHSISHQRFDTATREGLEGELRISKEYLTELGFNVKQYVAPFSTFPSEHIDLLPKYYEAAYTSYVDPNKPNKSKVIFGGKDRYEIHRVSMQGKSIEELKAYIDYVDENRVWIVFYEHEIDTKKKYTNSETLEELLEYIELKDVEVLTGSTAVEIVMEEQY